MYSEEKEENEKYSKKLHITGQKNKLNIGTWNVRSLLKECKVENTIQEMTRLKMDIMGLSEIRYAGNGIRKYSDATLYYSGNPETGQSHYHGVGILVKKDLTKYVTNFLPYSERCLLLQLSGQPFNINIIQVYAPTADKGEQEIGTFYKQIDDIIRGIKSQEIIIVMGDLNAKVGKGAVNLIKK